MLRRIRSTGPSTRSPVVWLGVALLALAAFLALRSYRVDPPPLVRADGLLTCDAPLFDVLDDDTPERSVVRPEVLSARTAACDQTDTRLELAAIAAVAGVGMLWFARREVAELL